ncbi:MAG TPA: hypothetical protein VES42_12180 [Pilimelia sp.]|nr:hypothetical protein [Pilimelia sp.]
MTRETSFDDVVPPSDVAERERELARLLELAGTGHRPEPPGQWAARPGAGLLFSAPHEATQDRDGTRKSAERGTAPLAFALAAHVGGAALGTVEGRLVGDPNWDVGHPYVSRAHELAAGHPTIDLHMMRPRGVEVCVGLGPRPELAGGLWQVIVEEAVAGGLRASVNWPFGANPRTVTGQLQDKGLPAVQVELSWDCFDPGHPAMPRAWSALARAATRLTAAKRA